MRGSRTSILLLAACSGPPAAVPGPPGSAAPPRPEADARPDVPAGAAATRDAELAVRAARYVDAFTNSEPVLTRDGSRVVFVSNRDGLPQLYAADAAQPRAAPARLVATAQRVTGAFATADGRAILFRADSGGDEQWSIFRVGLDDKDLVELTPGERLNRDSFAVPDGAPDRLFFSARRTSEARSMVYVASALRPEPARAIYTDDKPAFLAGASPDGRAVLVRRFPSRAENFLIRIDAATGEHRTLYPPAGQQHAISDAAYSADGKLVYVATDLGAEQAAIVALEAATGRELARHAIAPPTAQPLAISVARRGGPIAVSLTVGSHSEIRLLDGAKLTPAAKVEMPLGQGGTPRFSEDGTRLVVQWSTPRAPTDLHAIEARTGKVAPLRQEDRPSLREMPAIETTVVEIPAPDGGKIPANVHLPPGEQGKPHPVLVVYHGGPASTSVIRWSASTAYFLSLGYAVVEPNVRGSIGFGRAFAEADNGRARLSAFNDIEASGRWVAKQPWADRDRLVAYGGSYGGYTTLIALSRWPELWRAGVDLYGIVDLKTFMATTSGWIREIYLAEFGDPDRDAAFLASISPLTGVDKIVDPTFVYAGANDPRVPRSESDLIVKALRQRGVPSEYMVALDEGHSIARRHNQLAFLARCARFLETHLR